MSAATRDSNVLPAGQSLHRARPNIARIHLPCGCPLASLLRRIRNDCPLSPRETASDVRPPAALQHVPGTVGRPATLAVSRVASLPCSETNMPELPEVETMRRGIAAVVGCKIVDIERPKCRKRPILI